MLQFIDIRKLHPHLDNPRKDLGDLTELAESIKVQGILQNLTVVPRIMGSKTESGPWQDGYTIVIGHRRFAAAKLAGLKEVPCTIATMTEQEQVATMLLENMQRSDLTVYEQAQGFQMLLDFGESVSDIAGCTGFSETTVRRRVKLLELDQEKFKAAALRGGTLLDYADLEQIENIDLRNSVLEKIGTPDFSWALKQAIAKETAEKNMVLLIEQLDTFATAIEKPGPDMRYVTMYYARDLKDFKKPNNAGTAQYYYVASEYNYATLYIEFTASQEDKEAVARRDQLREQAQVIQNALKEETQRAYNLRWEFINEYSNAKAKKHKNVIIEYLLRVMLDAYLDLENEDLFRILEIELPDDDEQYSFDAIAEKVSKEPERCLLAATYLSLDSERSGYFNWQNNHVEDDQLDMCYEFLEKLGYQMSEKERQLQDGTHELFQKEEVEQ